MNRKLSSGIRRGAMLLEILIALLVGLLAGAALLMLLTTTYSASGIISGKNAAELEARKQMDTLADQLRNAQSNQVLTVKQVFSAAAPADVTFYNDTTGDTTRFWRNTTVSPAALKKSVTVSGTTTTTTVLSGVTSLNFTYYLQAQSTYTAATSGWSTTLLPTATALEIPNIGAVGIAVTVTINGYSRQMNSTVRLRNSPAQ